MMRSRKAWWVALALLLTLVLAGCRAAALTPTARPFPPVAQNKDWRPVIRTFNGVEMVQVPPGCFWMGLENSRRDERPVHRVCFDAPFWIDRTEVTNAQYGSAGAYPGDNRPRENLTWFEARDFCRARGARLPTEAEWEYAARGPDGLIYPWGNALVSNFARLDRNSSDTADVGSYPFGASWVGALDMSGNVFEWVSSLYRPYPFDPADGREDDADTTGKRVYRGGWYTYIDHAAGSTMRFRLDPAERDWRIGFRCARSD